MLIKHLHTFLKMVYLYHHFQKSTWVIFLFFFCSKFFLVDHNFFFLLFRLCQWWFSIRHFSSRSVWVFMWCTVSLDQCCVIIHYFFLYFNGVLSCHQRGKKRVKSQLEFLHYLLFCQALWRLTRQSIQVFFTKFLSTFLHPFSTQIENFVIKNDVLKASWDVLCFFFLSATRSGESYGCDTLLNTFMINSVPFADYFDDATRFIDVCPQTCGKCSDGNIFYSWKKLFFIYIFVPYPHSTVYILFSKYVELYYIYPQVLFYQSFFLSFEYLKNKFGKVFFIWECKSKDPGHWKPFLINFFRKCPPFSFFAWDL